MQALKRLKGLLKKILNNKVFSMPLAAIALIFPRILNIKIILYPLLIVAILILGAKIADDLIEHSNRERNSGLTVKVLSSPHQKLRATLSKEEIIDRSGFGTGVVIWKTGHILTAAHLVNDDEPSKIVVEANRHRFPAKILARDITLDLMVIRVQHNFGKEIPIRTRRLGSWEKIYTIGCPYGACNSYVEGNFLFYGDQTVDTSLVDSGLFRLFVAGGSSGGGVFDENGNLTSVFQISHARNENFPSATIGTSSRAICNFLDKNRLPYKKARYTW